MATSPNLKVNVTADTSQFQKGMKGARQQVQDFDKTAGAASDKLLSMFGVNSGQIKNLTDNLAAAGRTFESIGSAGTTAFGNVALSAAGAASAISAIGVGALIAEFKVLVSEAETWRQTLEGSNAQLITAAYISTFKQAMSDQRSVGEAASTVMDKFKVGWNIVKEYFKSLTLGGFNMMSSTAAIMQIQYATKAAENAAEAQRAINEATLQQLNYSLTEQRINTQIADLMTTIQDKSTTRAAKEQAIADAETLINQKYDTQREIVEKLLEATKTKNAQASSSLEDKKKEVALEKQLLALDTQRSLELKTLQRGKNQLYTGAGAATKASAVPTVRQSYITDALALDYSNWDLFRHTVEIPVELKLKMPEKEEVVKQITDLTQQIESVVTDSFATLGSLIGELVGDLVTGGDAWGNFGRAALSAMADMAIKVGEMAISVGVAALAIQGALESLNGWAAIAAGTALVALGAAVKAGMSNIAAGRSATASSNVASSAVLSNYSEMTDIKVEVTGTLVASGSQLVAVLNNEAKRKEHTT